MRGSKSDQVADWRSVAVLSIIAQKQSPLREPDGIELESESEWWERGSGKGLPHRPARGCLRAARIRRHLEYRRYPTVRQPTRREEIYKAGFALIVWRAV